MWTRVEEPDGHHPKYLYCLRDVSRGWDWQSLEDIISFEKVFALRLPFLVPWLDLQAPPKRNYGVSVRLA
jgi:hypothetical protein